MTDTQVKPYTNADLNRDFATGPWCPKCGRFTPIHIMHEQNDKLHCAVCHSDGDSIKPPLWERCPECRPNNLAFDYEFKDWWSEDEMGKRHLFLPEQAADLCVQGVVKAVGSFHKLRHGALIEVRICSAGSIHEFKGESHHLPHAVAIATHRWRDAVEAKG